MNRNISIEDLLNEYITKKNYNHRSTRDGSHLRSENVKIVIESKKNKNKTEEDKFFSSFHSKVNSILNEIHQWNGDEKGYRDKLVKAFKDDIYKTLKSLGVGERKSKHVSNVLSKKYDERLEENDLNIIDELKKSDVMLSDFLTQSREKLKEEIEAFNKELDVEAWNGITFGKSGQVKNNLDNIANFFNSLSRVGGGENGNKLGKFGDKFGKEFENISEKAIGKLGLFNLALDGVISAVNLFSQQLQFTAQQSETDYNLISKEQQIRGQLSTAELQKESQLLQKSFEIATTNITNLANAEFSRYNGALQAKLQAFNDITGSAYKALDAELTYKYDIQRAQTEKRFSEADKDVLENKLNVSFLEQKNVSEAQRELNKTQFERETEKIRNSRISSAVSSVGTIAGGVVGGGLGLIGGPAGIGVGAVIGSKLVGDLGKSLADVNTQYKDFYYQLSTQNKEFGLQSKQIHQQYINLGTESITSIKNTALQASKAIVLQSIKLSEEEEKAFANFTSEIDKKWEEAEHNANDLGKSLGYTGNQLNNFERNLFNTQIEISKWGKTIEDIKRIQENYALNTGRNIQLTSDDLNKSFAMGTFWGDDVVSSLNDGMEIFNHSVADSNEMFFDMHKKVINIGLNSKRYSKDLINNLKLAEKYNFKGGVQSLMEMSKWAQNARFNVGSMDGMLDKVQTGGLEGIIKQSAELQVLGGNFAIGSDPLAMAYESYMDPEAYAKRMNSMIAGQGYINEKGEASFGIASMQMMRQYAESTGQDYKDVLNQARQRVKVDNIQKFVNPNNNFDDEQLSLIANKARFNEDTHSWEIATGQKDSNGKDILTDVSDITPEMLEMIVSDNNSDKGLEDVARESLSLQTQQLAAMNYMKADQMNNFDEFKTEHLQRMFNVLSDYNKNRTLYEEKVSQYLTAATKSQDALFKFYSEQTPDTIAENFNKNIVDNLSTIQGQLDSIIEEIGAKYGVAGKELDKVGGDEKLLMLEKFLGDKPTEMMEKLKDTNSSWYTGEIKHTMEMLREDSSGLKKIKDFSLRNQLAKAIYEWDDDWTTVDLNYNHDEELFNVYKDALGFQQATSNSGGGIRNMPFNSFGDRARNIDDGLIVKNGIPTRIDDNDQVLAAKEGGPVDKMISLISGASNNVLPYAESDVTPRPMAYDSFVSDTPYIGNNNAQSNIGKIDIAPIQITINGSIQVNGNNGSFDITQQIANDPNFIRSLTQMISLEVEKKVNGGRVANPLNRNLSY